MRTWRRLRAVSPDPWVVASFGLAVAAALLVLLLPTIAVRTADQPTRHVGLLHEQSGWLVIVVVIVPVIFTALPFARGRLPTRFLTIAAAALLTVGVVVASPTIGLYFVPSATAMIIAAVRAARHRGAWPPQSRGNTA